MSTTKTTRMTTNTDTRMVPVERTTSLWPYDRDERDIFSRDLTDIDKHWREMDNWMERVWREHPFPSKDVDFFRPSRSFSDAMNRMREEIDRLWKESGFTPMREMSTWSRDAAPIMDRDKFAVNVDVNGFEPEDLKVTVNDDYLSLEGRHEERSPDGSRYVSRQFSRKYALPRDVDSERVQSVLSLAGKTLKVEAPRRPAEIEYNKGRETPVSILRSSSKIREIEDRRSRTPTRMA